eukprot:symbB.v1.2.010151.t1/scaffold660.1/size175713/8
MAKAAKRRKVTVKELQSPEDPDRKYLTKMTMAITLKGSVITEAILHGYKDVENRSVRLPLGWIALHTGKGKCDALLDQIMRRLAPGLPEDSKCPKGFVVGAAWVERAVTFDELRDQFGCKEECNGPTPGDLRHVPKCTFSPHAGGPFCNILSASIRLPTPVPCNGELGCWRLPDKVREDVLKQIETETVPIFHFPEIHPRPRGWPLPWAPELSRKDVYWHRDFAKQKQKATPQTTTSVSKAASLHRFFTASGTSKSLTAQDAGCCIIDLESSKEDLPIPSGTGTAPSSAPPMHQDQLLCIDIELESDEERETKNGAGQLVDLDRWLVFCCPALPVVLSVGRISNTLGIPYAFCKGRRITPSYSCGRGLGTHVDMPAEQGRSAQTAVDSLRYAVVKLNLERKKKRLAEKKRKRALHDLKRFPRIFLMCDSASAAWLLRQLDPNRTILVVDEPPMGSDVYPDKPEDNPLACAMMQAMMTPMYKTILMSATLPRPTALPTLVNAFLDRFKIPMAKKEMHIRECMSTQLDRGAVLCGPSGAVAFPHQNVQSADELRKLCLRLPADPLVLKAYTERALATLLLRWRSCFTLFFSVAACCCCTWSLKSSSLTWTSSTGEDVRQSCAAEGADSPCAGLAWLSVARLTWRTLPNEHGLKRTVALVVGAL